MRQLLAGAALALLLLCAYAVALRRDPHTAPRNKRILVGPRRTPLRGR